MINIGLLGLGTVGGGVATLLKQNAEAISKRIGTTFNIKKILVKNKNKKRSPLFLKKITYDVEEILEDDEIKIVVELLGGYMPAYTYIKKALNSGKHVVTANKEVIAKHGKELLELASKNKVNLFFEASVGGGIPIIRPMKHCLVGNNIKNIIGILNGTTNYILTQMTEKGIQFDKALKDAQKKGYAESDPTDDIKGYDAARKLAILSSIAFNMRLTPENIKARGIERIEAKDIKYAREMGCIIKLIAQARKQKEGIELFVSPAFLKSTHPLAGVRNAYNAIYLEGDAVGKVMFYGQGAGMMPTASAVVSDIMDVIRNNNVNGSYCNCYNDTKIMNLDYSISSFYVRLKVKDEPGVLSKISGILGIKDISLSTVIQKNTKDQVAEVVLVTYDVLLKNMQQAINEIKYLDVVKEVANVIRVVGEY